ncbi:hypothetical protein HY605_03650 [Candidatus Peregrinibacteria bacterium]|nr:hypothetical protein [Candidatus Peregrinibacteria bacterium]
MSDLGIFTISREDVYDYLRCPKIVAIKSYRALHPPERTKPTIRAEPAVPASVIGKIGEAAVAAAFSPVATATESLNALKEVVAHQTISTVSSMGVTLDASARGILDETVKGITEIRKFITDEYGDIQVIGKGGCKNGPFPGEALPDFVALTPTRKQPILIEVKNSSKPLKTDRFQATFYNTVARETGVVVHEQRVEEGKLVLTPVAYHESIADTLVIYPRGGSYERIDSQIDMSGSTIQRIWQAKQLGFTGKSPHTDCDTKCPHYRLGVDLPEGNLEAATPPPLIYAKGLTEVDFNLDTDYLHNFFWKSGLASGIYYELFMARDDPDRIKKIAGQIAARINIPQDIVKRMAFPQQITPDSNKIMKSMASDFEPWEMILGKERIKSIGYSTIQGLATRFYTLPDRSEEFVKRSWSKWQT